MLFNCKIFVIRLQNVSRGVRVSETCVIKHQPAKDVAFYFLKILFQKDPNKEVVMGRFAFLCLCCPLSVFSIVVKSAQQNAHQDIKGKIFLNFPNSLIWTNLPPGSDMSARLAATGSVNTCTKIQICNLSKREKNEKKHFPQNSTI